MAVRFHSDDEDDAEAEILGLRWLLREAVGRDAYADISESDVLEFGRRESDRLRALGHRIWLETLTASRSSQQSHADLMRERWALEDVL